MFASSRRSTAGAGGLFGFVLALSFAVAPAADAATIQFAPSANYPTGASGAPGPHENSVASADFTADSRPDVVLANFNTPGITVVLNKGDGTFKTPGTQVSVAATNATVVNVVTGEFNGDGKADLLAGSDSALYSLLGKGDGTFTPKASYTVQQSPFQDTLAIADFNRDGRADAAVKTPSGIQMMLGKGDGTFATGPLSRISTSFPGGISSIAPANRDGNAIPDLLAVDGGSQQVFGLRGNGDGSFTVSGSACTCFVAGGTGFVAGTVLAGDFNHDGLDDAMALTEFNSTGSSAAEFLSTPAGGFATAKRFDGGVNPVSGAVGDLNRDGNVDLVSSDTTTNQEVVLAGDGKAGFTVGKFRVGATYPQTPAVADFDGDARPDIATVGSGTLSVLRNTTP